MMEALNMQPVSVLVPDGRDPAIDYSAGPGTPAKGLHPPVNYHAYAACTGGGFFDSTEKAIAANCPILLVLRKRLKEGLAALRRIRKAGLPVAITLKESGRHQVAELLATPRNLELLSTLCREAGAAIASTPWLVPLYSALGASPDRTAFIPTPYPVDHKEWNFSRQFTGREGIFIGTREFFVPSRNHLLALGIAKQIGCLVTVVNMDGKKGRCLLEGLNFPSNQLTVLEKRLDYPDYLKVMNHHRIVLQCDRSGVPGQVAGDALLCRMPCIGGDGAVDQICTPSSSDLSLKAVTRAIQEESSWSSLVAEAQANAAVDLSFEAVAKKLSRYWGVSVS